MTDFFPTIEALVARAEANGDDGIEIRRSLYERARSAMLAAFQKTAMSEEQIHAEELSFYEAVAKVEAKYAQVAPTPQPVVVDAIEEAVSPTQAEPEARLEPITAPTITQIDAIELGPLPKPQEPIRYRGKVESFNQDTRKGWIKLLGEPTEHIKDFAALAIADFQADTPPMKGEEVEFSLKPNNKERAPRAIKVDRLKNRHRGQVVVWNDDDQFGFIKCPDFRDNIYVRYKEIQAEGPRELIVGEEVEFETQTTDKSLSAVRVRVFQSRFPLERFADIEKLRSGELLDVLAGRDGKGGLAQAEDWTYKQKNKKYPHPVLFSYIVYTFAQLLQEDKLAFATDRNGKKVACGNTGLLTNLQEDIYAFFLENRDKSIPQKWTLDRFVTGADGRLNSFSKLPEIANYFNNPVDLIFDASLELRERAEHILEHNLERFPVEVQSNRHQLKQNYDGALANARKRVLRNYKTAIPQFHKGQLQLLLPLCMRHSNIADLALVVSKEGQTYIASTVLELDDAYNNARLIARPDREWL
ncbi:DUF3825 domain-containing protein [Bradyrhizobium sp. LTSP885]|uniref:DUF3825 domain-containing protein n=1 Tax=Bradyrhizobium sp. LTSP885 TaxID=1619232 RepID=UPI00069A74DF|nr:DUF3825 domain-containing protein [Bradyrhizobium sp. LTSP885]